MASRTKKTWRKSDQTNADLPIGRTWIDDFGALAELVVAYANSPRYREKIWVAYPYGCPAYHITGNGPGEVVKAWDRKVSYEREIQRAKSNGQDYI